MKRIRKLLSILVALCVIFSVIPAAAAADQSAAFALQNLSIALPEADSMGFPLDKLEQETVSGAEMAELLDKLVTSSWRHGSPCCPSSGYLKER